MRKQSSNFSFILVLAATIVAAIVALFNLQNSVFSSIALEQEPYCRVEEHTHSTSCYDGTKLTCTKPAHSHNSNCYLLLLKDNDINSLLSSVDSTTGKSLNHLISNTVYTAKALTYGSDAAADSKSVTGLDIRLINDTISDNNISPAVTLNNDLYKSAVLSEAPTDSSLFAAIDSVSTDINIVRASTSNNSANFYIQIDNTWECIGSETFSVSQSSWYYVARMGTSTMLEFLNDTLGTAFTRNDISLKYASSATTAERNWDTADITSSYTVFGDDWSRRNSARAAKYVRVYDSEGLPISYYTVRLNYVDGTSETFYVRSGSAVTLPTDYNWSDGSTEYSGGQDIQIFAPTTLTQVENDGKYRIIYDINFPTVSGVTVSTYPTIYGIGTNTHTDVTERFTSTTIRNVTQHEVRATVNNASNGLTRIIRFSGWRVGDSNVILSANSSLTWDEFEAYSDGSRLTLSAVWEYRPEQTASFFVRYDSVAVDSGGQVSGQDQTKYTPEIFSTFVGGEDAQNLSWDALHDKYHVVDSSIDNSFTADQTIRSLYGEQAGIWLQSFPDDDYVFEQLKQYAEYLSVDGEPVNVNELNDSAYTIRWYVMKCQTDAWHIDGRLVKKEGLIHVTKSFAGNKDGIDMAKNNFYIEAYNGDDDHRYILTLEPVSNPTSHPGYRAGAKFITPKTSNTSTEYYLWELNEIIFGEPWIITEYPGEVDSEDIKVHSSYTVVDIENIQNKSGNGTTVNVDGVTYATDADHYEVLRVEFTNIYLFTNSIVIKKEDATTGNPLGGAIFSLIQDGNPLRFSYDSERERFIYDPIGEHTQLSGSQSGYYEIYIAGFSYDNGDITIQELSPPAGYTPIENILLGYETDPNTGQSNGNIAILNDSPLVSYNDGLLTVQNTTESTSVTAKKEWLCPEAEWNDVTVQLLADGMVVTSIVPGVDPTAVLNEDNGYTYTWTGLPLFANGREIKWSIREIKIGSENCKTDYTFANWLPHYLEPIYTYENGKVTNTLLTVQNDTRRTLLRLIKTNKDGSIRLEGATFVLERLLVQSDGTYTTDSDFLVRTQTTAWDGTLTFDNLLFGTYRLRETVSPVGYIDNTEPIYLTILEDGTITVESHSYAQAGDTAYTIYVRNESKRPLPETGGGGTDIYTVVGTAFILISAAVYILPTFKERRRKHSEQR